MTDDLMQFLRDRLDEDERTARAATQGDWVWSREFVTPPGYHHRTIGPLEPGDAAYIARHDPARVLREVEAKRRTIDRHTPHSMGGCRSCERPHWGVQVCNHCERAAPCPDLRDLATVHADHPDYRQEWRP